MRKFIYVLSFFLLFNPFLYAHGSIWGVCNCAQIMNLPPSKTQMKLKMEKTEYTKGEPIVVILSIYNDMSSKRGFTTPEGANFLTFHLKASQAAKVEKFCPVTESLRITTHVQVGPLDTFEHKIVDFLHKDNTGLVRKTGECSLPAGSYEFYLAREDDRSNVVTFTVK